MSLIEIIGSGFGFDEPAGGVIDPPAFPKTNLLIDYPS